MILQLAYREIPALVRVDTHRILNRFLPREAFGGCIDGMDRGDAHLKLTSENVRLMKSMGISSVSYRLRTELACEAWHWNPVGSWSDPKHHCGYWVGSATVANPILLSWGYRLPRRGNTIDQANNDGYSRLDDGDPSTYWKSNPYLDPPNAKGDHPQWVGVDFDSPKKIDSVRILWANPFPLNVEAQYWQGAQDLSPDDAPSGTWKRFDGGRFVGHAGTEARRFRSPKTSRYFRLVLRQSSHTSEDPSGGDWRDRAGFAIRELDFGRTVAGKFVSQMRHAKANSQTRMWTSSTDMWHRDTDRDASVEQPGFDYLRRAGLWDLPMLVPIAVMYDTPENAEAEATWLKAAHVRVRGFELGEEPDGQHVQATDFGSLYSKVAARLRRSFPEAILGGPSLQSIEADSAQWSDNEPRRSWVRLFLDQIRQEKAAGLFNFFSFESYPFDHPWAPSGPQVASAASELLAEIRRLTIKEGLPVRLPMIMGEYGYSAFAGPSDLQVQAALVNLDSVGAFLSAGGKAAFLYGWVPDALITEENSSWGNLTALLMNDGNLKPEPMPTYWAAKLMTQAWQRGELKHSVVVCSCADRRIGAYALLRPDGSLGVLIVNRDPRRSFALRLQANGRPIRTGRLTMWGSRQYRWKHVTPGNLPSRNLPPAISRFSNAVRIPPYTAAIAEFRP